MTPPKDQRSDLDRNAPWRSVAASRGGRAMWRKRREREAAAAEMLAALEELVALKDLHDKEPDSAEYRARKDAAWQAGRAAIRRAREVGG